jgi:hypothetical protein
MQPRSKLGRLKGSNIFNKGFDRDTVFISFLRKNTKILAAHFGGLIGCDSVFGSCGVAGLRAIPVGWGHTRHAHPQ